MKVGSKVKVCANPLLAKHPGIRFDGTQGAAAVSAPKGTSGEVRQLSDDKNECLVELYWNETGRPGAGHTWRIWVKRSWFGNLFE